MGEVTFSTKKEPAIVKPDKSWYKPYCHRCPYLIRETAFDIEEDNNVAIRCVRPIGENCLALSPLVSAFTMAEMFEEARRKVVAKEEPKSVEQVLIGAATQKRRKKIVKRRR